MTSALQSAAVSPIQGSFTAEQVDLIKRTICPDATEDELALFVQRCRSTGLDPFTGQIYLVKRKGSPATMQTGIDGFRLVAQRTGERDGMDAPQWCGKDGIFHPIWTGSEPPVACSITVYRKGHSKGYPALAYWDFYAQTKAGGELNYMWSKGGPHMLAKCSEALALRQAFPNELSGLYTSDEMHQASEVTPLLDAPQITAEIAIEATKVIEELRTTKNKEEMAQLCPRIQLLPEAGKIMVRPAWKANVARLQEQD